MKVEFSWIFQLISLLAAYIFFVFSYSTLNMILSLAFQYAHHHMVNLAWLVSCFGLILQLMELMMIPVSQRMWSFRGSRHEKEDFWIFMELWHLWRMQSPPADTSSTLGCSVGHDHNSWCENRNWFPLMSGVKVLCEPDMTAQIPAKKTMAFANETLLSATPWDIYGLEAGHVFLSWHLFTTYTIRRKQHYKCHKSIFATKDMGLVQKLRFGHSGQICGSSTSPFPMRLALCLGGPRRVF